MDASVTTYSHFKLVHIMQQFRHVNRRVFSTTVWSSQVEFSLIESLHFETDITLDSTELVYKQDLSCHELCAIFSGY